MLHPAFMWKVDWRGKDQQMGLVERLVKELLGRLDMMEGISNIF